MNKVQDVTCNSGILGRIFGFGDLKVESSGTHGEITFRFAPKPEMLKEEICRAISRREADVNGIEERGGQIEPENFKWKEERSPTLALLTQPPSQPGGWVGRARALPGGGGMDLASLVRELERQRENGLDALYLASPANITYLSGFEFIPTERPIAAVLTRSGELAAFVPLLEAEHVEKYGRVDRVEWYPEYPDERHPMERLADLMRSMGLEGKRVGYDSDGYGHVFGYRGPRLSEVFKASYVYARDLVEKARIKKSPEEIEALKESAKWASLAHRLLQEYTRPGLYEDEISLKASYEATTMMIRALPGARGLGASAGFRGQVGPHSYYPHSLSIHARIRKGQVLVTGAGARVLGYSSELERTMILGKPTPEQEKYFNSMLEARKVALESIRAGVKCGDVDKAVRRFYKERGLEPYWRHHTGHGIGLEYHEAPFLDIGDQTILEPGMVLTVEPGIYVKDLGGFRHSDTILVAEDGYVKLTNYPEELDDLVIEE